MPLPARRDQDAARAWGPLTTPDVFVLDSDLRLRYRGAPDADHDDPSQEAAWLRAALDAVIAGGDARAGRDEAGGLLGQVEGVAGA